MKIQEAVKIYRCPGCMYGPEPTNCDNYNFTVGNGDCINHCPATYFSGRGKMLLGLPKGFNRLGPLTSVDKKVWQALTIFKDAERFRKGYGWYDKFNVPNWKYLDEHKNTIVRGLQPRLNTPFIHIFLGDYTAEIECITITNEDVEGMN